MMSLGPPVCPPSSGVASSRAWRGVKLGRRAGPLKVAILPSMAITRVTRRLRILNHLMQATEHLNTVMKYVLEESDAPPPLPADPNFDPKVDTLSTNIANPEEVRPEASARASVRPTMHVLRAFTKEMALAELAKAWEDTRSEADRERVRETARRLVASGDLTPGDIEHYAKR